MRTTLAPLLALVLFSLPTSAEAQQKEKFKPPEIKKVSIGFKVYNEKEMEQTGYKVGLWTPIYVEVFGGTDGVAKKGKMEPYLEITTADSDDVDTTIEIPVLVEPLKERVFVGYVKTGHLSTSNRDIRVKLHAGGRGLAPFTYEPAMNLNVDAHLYLTLGPRITDLYRAVRKIDRPAGGDKEEDFRFEHTVWHQVAYESEVERLPARWFGYNGVDLMILSTDKREFLTALNNQPEQLKAIAQWVRRGGRLLVPIAPQNQDAVHTLFKNEAGWQPPIPVAPPKASANHQLDRLTQVEVWGRAQHAFERANRAPITVATLDPGNIPPGDWEVLAESGQATGSLPLIARVRYGLGQITYFAFSFQDDAFFNWPGKEKFLQAVVAELGPRSNNQERGQKGDFWMKDDGRHTDPTTQLLAELDKFGVTPIDFGYVALFIILYILIVGPLDYFLLKYVFKRLEWTWITFPAVVLAVSVIAYFAAFALKGKDLKVNKVDIVDFDMRTSRDDRQARVYGHSFFSILSPRIQNYTIGLEPNPAFWGEEPGEPRSVDLMSWLGRPSGGPGDMGRSGSGGFFKSPYHYTEEASGLRGVPIPVWTTKAFYASWEQPLARTPFTFDLVYHQKPVQGNDLRITGKLRNHMNVDLVDAWLCYDNRFYAIGKIPRTPKAGEAFPVSIPDRDKGIKEWVNTVDPDDLPLGDGSQAQPVFIAKQMLFHEGFDTQRVMRNHLLRPLDQSWRLKDEPRGKTDRRTREAILIAQVLYPAGEADAQNKSTENPLPTRLWLQDLPGPGETCPTLDGQLNQVAFIRVILPIRPADE